MNPIEQITKILESKSDEEIKILIREYFTLHTLTGELKPDSPLRELALQICKICGINGYNLTLAERWLQDEVFKRFLNQK